MARLVKLCTSVDATGILEAGESACETDEYAEKAIRDALLDACKDDARLMRKILTLIE